MIIECNQCKNNFKRKPSDVRTKNFCGKECFLLYKIKNKDNERSFILKFIKKTWTSMNIRCGKYKHLQTKNKCLAYKDIKILFSREEYRDWCFENKNKILHLKRPSIDRMDSKKHYSLDNVDIIELDENIRKKRLGNTFVGGYKSKTLRGIRVLKNGKFSSRISFGKKEEYLGVFDTAYEAYLVFYNKYIEKWGKEPFDLASLKKLKKGK
jgi:hypothetical protein